MNCRHQKKTFWHKAAKLEGGDHENGSRCPLKNILLEYWLYTKGLDNLDAPIPRKFKFSQSFFRFVIFKALIEE